MPDGDTALGSRASRDPALPEPRVRPSADRRGRGTGIAFVVAFVVLAAIRHWENAPGGAFEAITVATALGGALVGFRDGRRLEFLRLFVCLALAFGLVSLLSIIQSSEPEAALKAWFRLTAAQALGLGCYLVTSDRHRLRWFTLGGMVGVGMIAIGSLGLFPIAFLPLDRVDAVGRTAGPVGDPNFFGQFLVVGLALAFAVMLAARRPGLRVLALVVVGVALLAALGTESRGTLLAMSAVAAVHFVRSSPGTRVTMVVLVGVIFAAAPTEARNDAIDRITRAPSSVSEVLATGVSEDTAVAGRLSEAIVSVDMVRDHPVTGIGIGTYRYRYLDYAVDVGFDPRAEERDAHSRYLEVTAETGLVGVAAWVALLSVCAVLAVGSVRRRSVPPDLHMASMAWMTAFVGWATTAVFLHDYQPEIEWLVFGAVFGSAEAVRAAAGRGVQRGSREPASSS